MYEVLPNVYNITISRFKLCSIFLFLIPCLLYYKHLVFVIILMG